MAKKDIPIDETNWVLRLGYLIHDVSRLRRTMFDRTLAPLGITRSQWWVLAFVSRKNGMPQSQLASELDLGKVALGALIKRLETAGFVTRRTDPVDRRLRRIYLTARANAFLKRLRKETDKFNADIVSGIDHEALEKASEALLTMKKTLLSMAKGTAVQNGDSAVVTSPVRIASRRKSRPPSSKAPLEPRHREPTRADP